MNKLWYTQDQIDKSIQWTKTAYEKLKNEKWKNAHDYWFSWEYNEYEFSSALFDAGMIKSGYTGVIDFQKNITVIDPKSEIKNFREKETWLWWLQRKNLAK